MELRFRLASVAARRGISIGTQASDADVRATIAGLHPVAISTPLIRIGGQGDGGYLVPDDLDGIVACFSPGVCETASFEEAMIARGIPCFLADASVEKAPVSGPLIQFERKFIGAHDDDLLMTMDSWIDRCAPPVGDLLLQMDIEGAEWPVLLNISEAALKRCRIIVLELHDVDRLIDKLGFKILSAVFARLTRHFTVVHNHPNNYGAMVSKGDIALPRVLEMTFLRNDRVDRTGYVTQFPHPLDVKNDRSAPDIVLPPIWHR